MSVLHDARGHNNLNNTESYILFVMVSSRDTAEMKYELDLLRQEAE